MKYKSKHQDMQIFVLKLNTYEFQPLEVVGRSSKTQLQVSEKLTEQDKGAKLELKHCVLK